MKTILGSLVGKLVKDSTQVAMTSKIKRNMGQGNLLTLGFGLAKRMPRLICWFISTRETTAQTQELMKATAIISSKTGRSYEDTAERIKSGMLGSTEAIEDLGIYTNISMIESTDAFKKFANGKSWAQLDFQVQQQID